MKEIISLCDETGWGYKFDKKLIKNLPFSNLLYPTPGGCSIKIVTHKGSCGWFIVPTGFSILFMLDKKEMIKSRDLHDICFLLQKHSKKEQINCKQSALKNTKFIKFIKEGIKNAR